MNLCHTAGNFKNLFITQVEFIVCFCASSPMEALLTILLNTLCYFMADVSDMYTYSLLTYPLAGFDMTLSSSLIWCQKYKRLGLCMENGFPLQPAWSSGSCTCRSTVTLLCIWNGTPSCWKKWCLVSLVEYQACLQQVKSDNSINWFSALWKSSVLY
jgi:hypothetical protein